MPVAPVAYKTRKKAPEGGGAGEDAGGRQNTGKSSAGSLIPKLGTQLGIKRIRLISRLRT